MSELGDGWKAAVIDTRDEYVIIEYSQYVLSDVQDYFVGGSAKPEVLGPFDYLAVDHPYFTPSYSTYQTGKVFAYNKGMSS